MFRIALKYGILIVVFIFLWGVMEYMAGVHLHYLDYRPVLALLSLTIPMIFIYLGIREAQKNYTGYFTYGQAFKTGLFISLVVAVINPIGQWIFFTTVSPEYFESIQAYNQSEVVALGAEERVSSGSATLGNYLIWSAFVGALVAGIVISAILAIFVRDKNLPKGG